MPADHRAGPGPRIFLSYRRRDAGYQADTLYRLLADAFGADRVFKDVDSIPLGDEFARAIERAVAACTVLLALIGDRWLSAVDAAGVRRLDDPGDFVRLEIESALRAGVRVVPVLLGVEPPRPEELPPSLAALPGRQAVTLAPERFSESAGQFVARLARLLEVAPGAAPPDVPPDAESTPSAYRMQIADIAPATLDGREAELALLARFAAGPAPYAWWQAHAWAGKTALMSWFAVHPPPGLDVAAFFVVGGLAGQCDSDAFLEALAEQLTALAGRPPGPPVTTAVRRGRLLELLAAATARSRSRGRRLVLLVDGLDEDAGPVTGKQSIASLLPRYPPEGLRILVTGRLHQDLPRDLPADHPLLGCRPHRIAPSAAAHDVELFAKRQLMAQLGDGALHEDLLGLIAASGGGLAQDDLVRLTGGSARAVDTLLRGGLGRTVQGRRRRLAGTGSGTARGYLFAHDTLRQLAEQEFGARLTGYRERIAAWADGHRDRHWPAETPQYLLGDYPRMLVHAGEHTRLAALAGDPLRHDRLLELTGGDALALDEIALAQAAVSAADPPMLSAAVALTLRRVELGRRNALVPVELPSVWAALGDATRAESLARGIPRAASRETALGEAARAAAATGRSADAEVLLDRVTDPARWDRAAAAVVAETARIDPDRAARLAHRIRDGEPRRSAEIAVAAARAAADPVRGPDPAAWRGKLPRELSTVRARTELAVALARAGRPGAAETVVAAGPGRAGLPSTARARIAGALAAAGAAAAAERLIAGLRAALTRARALADLVVVTAADGDPDIAARLLAELRDAVARVTDPRSTVDLLLTSTTALAGAGRPDVVADTARQVEQVLDTVPGPPPWVAARRMVARAAAGHWPEPTAPRALGDPDTAARTARELALLAEAAGRPEWTAALTAAIPDRRRRAEVLTALARAAVARGRPERAAALARTAERTARAGADGERLDAAADQVVDGLLGLGDRAGAAALADRITEPDRRESALGRVAAAEAGAGRIEVARALLGPLAPSRQAWGLADLARRAAQAGDGAAAAAVVAQVETLLPQVPDRFSRLAVLLRVARVPDPVGGPGRASALLDAAERAADGLTDPDRQARALALLAVTAVDRGDHERGARLHERAADALDRIPGEPARSRAQARLAEGLAELGHVEAAADRLRHVRAPAARIRATCAVAAADPTRADRLLAEAAALVATVDAVEERYPVLARLAVTAAAVARATGRPADPARTVRPVVELLAGEAWASAAPALAHLDPEAFGLLAGAVRDQLPTPGG